MRLPLFLLAITLLQAVHAQDDDLLSLLGEDSTVEYTTASFKATRVINGNSIENTAHGVLDFRISHRFGYLSAGNEEFWGLDQAFIRLGLDYGVTERLMVGLGRSSYNKTVDGFFKYKILRQCDQGCSTPLTLSFAAGMDITTLADDKLPWYQEGRELYMSQRMGYYFQLIAGRKFNERFTLQLMPGLVHNNMVRTAEDAHDVINIGGAGRYKITKRMAINGEYFYVLPDQLPEPVSPGDPEFHNSFSVGLDIETGGHVFQLHCTNSFPMFERGFITQTTGDWLDGDISFGFNISRVFTVHDPKAKARKKAGAQGNGSW
ncbi:MAG: hypothetical protein JNL05_00310 [Flavobacteriales bacterium]|nr:hypothetical protein [Flavobacteriales bacterium]